MHPQRKQRLIFILSLITGIAIAIGLTLFALRQNINLFITPSQIAEGKISPLQHFRLGGIVKKGSIITSATSTKISFILTDGHHQITVNYQGLLPALFREGQDIVAEGRLNSQQVFQADQVLAKHDANYHPATLTLKKGQ